MIEKINNIDLFSRILMAICTFPATFFHYSDLRSWAAGLRSGRFFFSAVLNEPDISRKRLAEKPKLVSVPVRIGLSIAQIIRKNCGVLPALRNMFYVLKLEGFSGIRVRVLNGEKKWNEGAAFREPPNPNRILVMDYRIPMAEVSAGERATVGILSDLCKLGYEVVFLP
ncbi:MAG: hypothetical protein ACU83O_11325, partial [Gammaproteobacteria bacterium]